MDLIFRERKLKSIYLYSLACLIENRFIYLIFCSFNFWQVNIDLLTFCEFSFLIHLKTRSSVAHSISGELV